MRVARLKTCLCKLQCDAVMCGELACARCVLLELLGKVAVCARFLFRLVVCKLQCGVVMSRVRVARFEDLLCASCSVA